MESTKKYRNQSGQLMVLSAFVVSVAMLTVTAISGLLTLFQLQQVENYENSEQAIFAADAGVELVFYNEFNPGQGSGPGECENTSQCDFAKINPLTNGARYKYHICNGILVTNGAAGAQKRYSARSFEVSGFSGGDCNDK